MKTEAILSVDGSMEQPKQLNTIHEDIAAGHREQARNLARMAELQERLKNALRELEIVLNHEHKKGP